MADRRFEATGHETAATSPNGEAYADRGISSAQIAERPRITRRSRATAPRCRRAARHGGAFSRGEAVQRLGGRGIGREQDPSASSASVTPTGVPKTVVVLKNESAPAALLRRKA
jgi:hypothetical protein